MKTIKSANKRRIHRGAETFEKRLNDNSNVCSILQSYLPVVCELVQALIHHINITVKQFQYGGIAGMVVNAGTLLEQFRLLSAPMLIFLLDFRNLGHMHS